MFIPWFTRNSKVSLVLCWPIPESKFNRLTLGIAGASAIDTAMVFGPTTSMTDFIRRTLSWGPWSQVTDAFLIGELMGPLWYGKGERNWSRWWYNYDGTLAFNDIQGTMVLPITAVSWCVVLHITAESDICHHSPVTRQVTSAVWFGEIKALPVHFNLVFSHLEFRQLEEDTRLHMAGVNGEITWGKPVCEHLMVWLYWLYWFMKACAEISHQGCVQECFTDTQKRTGTKSESWSLSSPTSSVFPSQEQSEATPPAMGRRWKGQPWILTLDWGLLSNLKMGDS